MIGWVANTGTGTEFLGLMESSGTATIASLLFSLVGREPACLAIGTLHFGTAGQVVMTPAPLALLGVGGLGLSLMRCIHPPATA